MSQEAQPVTVSVVRPDGSVERLLVGHAVQGPGGLELKLHSLDIGLAPTTPVAAQHPATANRPSLKGAAVVAHTIEDLQRMAERARRALADPRKQRWHADERTLLGEIEAELARKRGGLLELAVSR